MWQGRVNTFHPGRGNILALMSVPLIRFPRISVIYGSLHRYQRPGRNILTGHVNFSRENTKLNQSIGTRIQRILFFFPAMLTYISMLLYSTGNIRYVFWRRCQELFCLRRHRNIYIADVHIAIIVFAELI